MQKETCGSARTLDEVEVAADQVRDVGGHVVVRGVDQQLLVPVDAGGGGRSRHLELRAPLNLERPCGRRKGAGANTRLLRGVKSEPRHQRQRLAGTHEACRLAADPAHTGLAHRRLTWIAACREQFRLNTKTERGARLHTWRTH